jgi:hypothetical protein
MPNSSYSQTPLDSNFIEVINLLNERGIPYWVCHGTLLGLVRDGNLIPWDHDVDIALWSGALPKPELIVLLTAAGYHLKSDGADFDFVGFTKSGGREVDFNYYRRPKGEEIAYSEWPIFDSKWVGFLEVLANRSDYSGRWPWVVKRLRRLRPIWCTAIRLLKRYNWCYRSAGYTTPVRFIDEFEMVGIGDLSIRMPRKREAVLEFVYGKNWRVPKPQYDWRTESPSTRTSKERFTPEAGRH